MKQLLGRPWVASFVFTRCITTCPTITLAMKQLHDRVIQHDPDVMFVTMTVDSKHDTATILQRYSETYSPDRNRWKFLTGEMDAMHGLIVRDFGIYVKENIGAQRRPGLEVAHSNKVVLINTEGIPVGTFLATDPAQMANLARILTGKKSFPQPGPPLRVSRVDRTGAGLDVELRPIAPDDVTDPEKTPGKAVDATQSGEDSGDSDSTSSAADKSLFPHPSTLSIPQRLARIDSLLPQWAHRLPVANALLNGTSTALLTLGWFAIRKKRVTLHRNAMIAAFVISIVFLGSYLTSHWALAEYTEERGRPFGGGTAATWIYRLILWPHIILAATVPFFAVRVLHHAFRKRWQKHRRLARIAFPVWMYVSVTGVVIYAMLYHWPSA